MSEAMAAGGNPSSVHAEGRRVRAMIERARETLAASLCARVEDVVFTSGATEAVNLAILGAVAAGATRRLLVSAIEHDAVREAAGASGVAVETVPVRAAGVLDLDALAARLARWDAADGRPFLALQHANNETGVVQPVVEAGRMLREQNGLLLVDAAQTLGKIPVDVGALWADYVAVSAHKLGGPAGVGALALGPAAPLARRQHGGGQERGRRGGTENVVGIAGFGAGLSAALSDAGFGQRLAALRDSLEGRIRDAWPDVRVWGDLAPRLPHVSCLALTGFRGETQVMALDLAGVAVSAGSACSSGKVRASRVLEAMGADAGEASCAIRVSLGWNTTSSDLDRFVEAYVAAAARAVGPARADVSEPARGAA
jgi:cysteine desulfurase